MSERLNRRDFLKGILATGAAAITPESVLAQEKYEEPKTGKEALERLERSMQMLSDMKESELRTNVLKQVRPVLKQRMQKAKDMLTADTIRWTNKAKSNQEEVDEISRMYDRIEELEKQLDSYQ